MLVRFNKTTIIAGTTYAKDAEADIANDLADRVVSDGNGVVVGLGARSNEVYAQTNADGSTSLVGPDGVIPDLLYSRIVGKRPKLMSIGNSINGSNSLQSGTYWGAASYLMWAHAIMGAPFDRCRSAPKNWGAQGNAGGDETLDALGCYSWGGATLAGGTYNLLPRLTQVFSRMIDAPDVIYLPALVENDLGGGSPVGATIVGYIKQAIELCRTAFPNALIILATPGPSVYYANAAQHTAFAYVDAWVRTVNSEYDNVLPEINTAYLTNVDQPLSGYTDGVHPNFRGGFVRGKSFAQQFAWLFPNALPFPTADSSHGCYQYNPNFTKTGTPGSVPPGNATVVQGVDFYTDTNVGADLTFLSGGGINMVLTSTGAISLAAGTGPTSDATTTTIVDSDVYVGVARVEVVNPANLFGFNFVAHVGSADYQTCVMSNSELAGNPTGLSDLLLAGDTFTFVTPEVLPPDASTSIGYLQLKARLCTTIPTGAAGANNPSINIHYQNAIRIENHLPVAPAVGASPYSYQNNTTKPQQVFVSGGTVSAYQFSRDGGTTLFTALPTTGGAVVLAPGDTLKVTYTVAPTLTVVAL